MLYEIVPPGYEFVLVKGDGLRFFAAACSFLARLSARVPAACLAEQLIANAIVDRAQDKLAKMEDCGDITRGQRISASGSLNGVYEFVGDDFSILFEVEARTSDEDLIFELFEPLDEELSIGLMRALSPE